MAKPLCFQPDGQTLLAEQNGTLVYWLPSGSRVPLGQEAKPTRLRAYLRAAAYSQDGNLLALLYADKEKTLEITTRYDTVTLLEVQGAEWVRWCQQDILAVGYGAHVELWSVNGEKKLKTFDIDREKEGWINGLCYDKERQVLLCVTQHGQLYHWPVSHDALRRKSEPNRPMGNIGATKYGSLRIVESAPLTVAALTNEEVKAWRFYDGKIEPVAARSEGLRNEFEYYENLSPSAKWTTVFRHNQGVGHVLWLAPVTIDGPKKK
jgi:hypothetical protein